jgi:hypothetical protein
MSAMKSALIHCAVEMCAMGLALAIARDAGAQTVTGRVRLKGEGSPVAGAIVALVDSTGRAVVARLANDSGVFVLTAPFPGTYTLRVERVGFRVTTSPRFLVRQDAPTEVPVMVAGDAVALRAVTVNADRRCLVRPQEGLATAQLWEEARKALDATQLTQLAQAAARTGRDSRRFAVRVRSFKRDLEPTTLAPQRNQEVEREGESVTPFVSLEPEKLARDGYMTGDVESGGTFYAPDATVLLSDRFLDTHCFRPQAPERGRRDDLIGLAFEPVKIDRTTRRVDVHGVLWLDRATAELRYMEFGFSNLPFEASAAQAGGRLEFRPLPDGRWIVWRWYIRMPRLERYRNTLNGQLGEWQLRITGIQEEGGELLEVRPSGSVRQTVATLYGTIIDSVKGRPLSNARVFISGTSFATTTDSAGAYTLERLPPGIYLVSIMSPVIDSLLIDAPMRDISLNAGERKQVDFGVPSFRTLSNTLCGAPAPDSSSVIVGTVRRDDGAKALGSQVRVEWSDFTKPASDQLRIAQAGLETMSAAGRYALCAIPRDKLLTLQARSDKGRTSVAQPATHAGEVRRVDLTLRAP